MKKKVLLLLLLTWSIAGGFSQTITNIGTEFWIAFPHNSNNWSPQIYLYISSTVATSGSVICKIPGASQPFSVVPGVITQVQLPTAVVLSAGIEEKGIRVISQDPISLYGLNFWGASTGAFLALPVNSLGTDYRVMCYKMRSGFIIEDPSRFSIVGTVDSTIVTIFNHWTNLTENIRLDQGQTYLSEFNPSTNQDVTGSRIQSTHPVAVFGSNDCVEIPDEYCQACDYICEQMFPTYAWGKNFGTVALAGRNNSGDIFRIVSNDDANEIRINGIAVTSINAGDYYEAELTGNNYITSSKPSMLAQFAKGDQCSGGYGDPMMMLIPPLEQFLTNYTISSIPPFMTNYVNLIAPSEALGNIYEDGVLIPNSAFTIIAGTNYHGAQRTVTQGTHNFTGNYPFGVFAYGWASADAYGYPGGCSISLVATVDTILLSPDTAYGQLNVTNVCLTATVLNSLSNPVEGVLVNFHVGGLGNLSGTGYSDVSGNAQYCYMRTGTSQGTDYIYAEISGHRSDSSVVIWSGTPPPCVNPSGGGTIGHAQSGCGSFTPAPLVSLTAPSGYTGTLEYKWQVSLTGSSSGFLDIPASNSAAFTPGILTQTSWFRRLAKVNCLTSWPSNAISNVIELTVVPQVIAGVIIQPSTNDICAGTSVTFTSNPTNGGQSPAFQWRVNSNNINLATSNSYTYAPSNNDTVTCALTSSETCVAVNPVMSIPVYMTVNPLLPVSVSVTASANPVCNGTSVSFTATPVNGGNLPVYIWKRNGSVTDTNSPVFNYIPNDRDTIICELISDEPCKTGSPALSVPIIMNVNPALPVNISVSASSNPFCNGSPVAFTAVPVHGGTTPSYHWKVNGADAGSDSPVFTYVPSAGDLVNCTLNSSEMCATGNPATSNTISMQATTVLPAGISVTASPNPFCPGSPVTFVATPSNGGNSPWFEWLLNGLPVGNNTSSYLYNPAPGDLVSCLLTSTLSCVTNSPATSNVIQMLAHPVPNVIFSLCYDSITTTAAQPFLLKGGLPPGGTYSGPGVNAVTGIFNPATAGAGVKTINYSYANYYNCIANTSRQIWVLTPVPFICGNILTDIRDNKTYPTILIGQRCWMQKNLDYGVQIPESVPQTDNCMAEKYIRQATINSSHSTFYQWDELLQYNADEAARGLCPPGWHVPALSEWEELVAFYNGPGEAGAPLKDTNLPNGFHSLQGGFLYLCNLWAFESGPYAGSMYWTSTSVGSDRAVARGLNEFHHSVSKYFSSRGNALGVRCSKD